MVPSSHRTVRQSAASQTIKLRGTADFLQLAEQQFTPQQACKWMVTVLRIAADYDCEGSLVFELIPQTEGGQLLDLKVLQESIYSTLNRRLSLYANTQ